MLRSPNACPVRWETFVPCAARYRFVDTQRGIARKEIMNIKGIIFDLDGVIVFTDHYHYLAWKGIADEMGIYFDGTINNRLRGVSRMESLEIILENYHGTPLSEDEKVALAEKKNNFYRELLQEMSPASVAPEVRSTLQTLRERGYKLSIGSSSKNTKTILERVQLTDAFDAISDGTNITRSKPDPEVYLKTAEKLATDVTQCLVFEDSIAGATAAISAGMRTCVVPQIKQPNTFVRQNAFKVYRSLEDIYSDMEDLTA